jgi:predicted nucleic acid-binding protein
MIVVDTSVWVDYFNGRATPATDRLDFLLPRELLVIGDLILIEVLQGFRSARNFRSASEYLNTLDFRAMAGREVALASARNYRRLRERGVTVRKTIGVIIGTFCIESGHELLHSDRAFGPMARHLGLRVAKV